MLRIPQVDPCCSSCSESGGGVGEATFYLYTLKARGKGAKALPTEAEAEALYQQWQQAVALSDDAGGDKAQGKEENEEAEREILKEILGSKKLVAIVHNDVEYVQSLVLEAFALRPQV